MGGGGVVVVDFVVVFVVVVNATGNTETLTKVNDMKEYIASLTEIKKNTSKERISLPCL